MDNMLKIKSRRLAGLQLVILFLCLPATSIGVFAEELQAAQIKRADGSSIDFNLTKRRAGTWGQTLLVILQGSSCESVLTIRSISSTYAKLLADADILTIEKYGIAPGFSTRNGADHNQCPDEYFHYDSLDQRKNDVSSVLTQLSSQHKYERRILFGGSEGASLAIALASRGDLVDAVIAFNAGGRYFKDDVIHSMKATIGDEEARQAAVSGFTEFASRLTQPEPFPVKMSNHGYPWWKSMLENDQLSNLLVATVPVFVIQGGQDQNVSPVTWMDLRKQVENGDQQQVYFHYYPHLDHGLRNEAGQDESELVMTDIRAWIDSVLNTKLVQGDL